MMKKQNSDVIKMRHSLDARIVEVQLCQLDNEIKNCLKQIENSDVFPEEVFAHYESLKKERLLLVEQQEQAE